MGIGFIVKPGIILYRNIMVESTGNGSVSGGGRVLSGSTVTVTASPAADYTFEGWYDDKGNLVSTANPYQFVVRKDTRLEGRFALALRNIGFSFRDERVQVTNTVYYYHGIRPKSVTYRLGVAVDTPYYGYTTQTISSSGTYEFILYALANGATGYIRRNVIFDFQASYVNITAQGNDYGKEISGTLNYL